MMKHKTKSFGKEKDYFCELSILYYILFRALCSPGVNNRGFLFQLSREGGAKRNTFPYFFDTIETCSKSKGRPMEEMSKNGPVFFR